VFDQAFEGCGRERSELSRIKRCSGKLQSPNGAYGKSAPGDCVKNKELKIEPGLLDHKAPHIVLAKA
jgi:hypothetical protein